MGNRVLLFGKRLTERTLEVKYLGQEQRVVSESVIPLRLMGYTALDRSAGIVLPTLLIKVDQVAYESSAALRILYIRQSIEQLRVVGSVIARFAGISGGMHARSTIKRIDFQAGIICQHRHTAASLLSRMSFNAGIAQKRLGILDGVGVNTSLLEGFELPTGEIERFSNLNGLVSVVAGNKHGFHNGSFRAEKRF